MKLASALLSNPAVTAVVADCRTIRPSFHT
jgi:hypothetical protein